MLLRQAVTSHVIVLVKLLPIVVFVFPIDFVV
jgi:hypothetical protein